MVFPPSEIQQALHGDISRYGIANTALHQLLTRADARAVGLWRLEGESLLLVAFAAKPDMLREVQKGFVDATLKVSLSQTKLGIVNAVVRRGPAVAHVDAGPDGLVDSASWLARFEAVQSLSMPIVQDDKIIGVLAVSTAHPFAEGDAVWNLITHLTEQIGQ